MLHITIEDPADIRERLDPGGPVGRVHWAARRTGVLPVGGIGTRAAERTCCRIAHGGDLATKRAAGEAPAAAGTSEARR